MKRCDLRLMGGQALLPGVGLAEVDVLVADGRVVGLCEANSAIDAASVVHIPGLTVLPGGIDPHVHLGQDLSFPKAAEDVTMETASAAAGGVTTILAYLMSSSPYEHDFERVRKLTEANSLIDFGFHFCITTQAQIDALPSYNRDLGVSSFKFFMNFKGEEGKYLNLPGNDDGFLYQLLQKVKATGGLLCPHMENIELVWRLRAPAHALHAPALEVWNATRPDFVEAEAIQRVGYLASVVKAPVYAVHVSCPEALQAALAQKQRFDQIYVETCPHYLTHGFDSGVGLLGKVNPPLRNPKNLETMWGALRLGQIDAVGSDHNARTKEKKAGDIWKAAAGFPGVETLLPILLSEGHVKRGIPLQRISAVASTNPAKIFGLYPRKGAIGVGSDADFAIVDLKAKHIVRTELLHSQAGYSIYDGWELSCRMVHALVRGCFVIREGTVQSQYGYGKYLSRPKRGAAEGGA